MVLPGGVRLEVPEAPVEGGDHPALGPTVNKVDLELGPVHHDDTAAALESASGVVTLDEPNPPGGLQPRPRAVTPALPDIFV